MLTESPLACFPTIHLNFIGHLIPNFSASFPSVQLQFLPVTVLPQKPSLIGIVHTPRKRSRQFYLFTVTSKTQNSSSTRLISLGIGIGLWPYVNFLAELKKLDFSSDDGQVGIIALEIMPISFRITSEALTRDEMCHEIQRILTFHGWEEFMLISHS